MKTHYVKKDGTALCGIKDFNWRKQGTQIKEFITCNRCLKILDKDD